MTAKPPRRKCPVCGKSFMNGRALRQHRWMVRDDPEHAAAAPQSAEPVVERRHDGKRTFDLTAEED